jgi:indole-3-glycerol phosphate synthase
MRTRIIAEVKRKSPSAGLIRADFDPVDIAARYHAAGASAISCLTDEPDFGGRLEFIQQIREHVPLPVLRKDFIVDAWQIWESRAAGADAILLIAECLTESEMVDLMILAPARVIEAVIGMAPDAALAMAGTRLRYCSRVWRGVWMALGAR